MTKQTKPESEFVGFAVGANADWSGAGDLVEGTDFSGNNSFASKSDMLAVDEHVGKNTYVQNSNQTVQKLVPGNRISDVRSATIGAETDEFIGRLQDVVNKTELVVFMEQLASFMG
ncbi:MAG: hypothetical protein AAF412_07900, partial [Pseudomonadota bacterium]